MGHHRAFKGDTLLTSFTEACRSHHRLLTHMASLHPPSSLVVAWAGGPDYVLLSSGGHAVPLSPSQLSLSGQEESAAVKRRCSGSVNHCMAHPHLSWGLLASKPALQGPSKWPQDGRLTWVSSDVISSATCALWDLA